jgi:predicted nuclease of restriction endonuclease-like (RecB) superfamily
VVRVGSKDFVLDLLFFNGALNSLVAIELKIDEVRRSACRGAESC